MFSYDKIKFLFLGVTVLLISSCATNGQNQTMYSGGGATANSSNTGSGLSVPEKLTWLENEYKNDSTDTKKLLAYARALRKEGYFNRANIILAPLAEKDDTPASVIAEYAMLNLFMDNLEVAEDYARKAVANDPDDVDAMYVLGIILDTKGNHEAAEEYLRSSYSNWQGDPVMVMNNLAINLMALGKLEEAKEILEDAINLAPDMTVLERNRKIVLALQESSALGMPGSVPNILKQSPKKQEVLDYNN